MGYIEDIRGRVGHDPIILTFAGGILVNAAGEILLQERTDFKGWGLFGGAMEFGESATTTCQREFREECGIDVDIDRLFAVSTNHLQNYPNGDVAQAVVITFMVHQTGGTLLADQDETRSLCWFTQNNLPPIFNIQHEHLIHSFFAGDTTYFE